jgi:hypothetical protein
MLLGFPSNRIDILTDIAGVDFKTCFNKKVVVKFKNTEINVISLIDLITNEQAAGRLQDLADAEKLNKLNK